MNRQEALDLFLQHNKDATHLKHALAVEGTMRHFAQKYGESEDLWGIVGLLHDIDWEKTQETPASAYVSGDNSSGGSRMFSGNCSCHALSCLGPLAAGGSSGEHHGKSALWSGRTYRFVTAVALVRPANPFRILK